MSFFKKKKQNLPALTKDNLMMYKRVWLTYVAPKWKLLTLSVVLMLVASSFDALLVSQLKPVFDEVFLDKNRAKIFRRGSVSSGLYNLIFTRFCFTNNASTHFQKRKKHVLFQKEKTKSARFDQRQPDDVQTGLADVCRAEMETADAVRRFDAGRIQFRRPAGQPAETRIRRSLSG